MKLLPKKINMACMSSTDLPMEKAHMRQPLLWMASTGKNNLSNLLDLEVAPQYNWTGAKGKREFQSLKINDIIKCKSP